jgi:hypothetical protein
MIKHPDHYPQDPYPYTQVYDAGQFVLPANAPLPTSVPNAQGAIPTLSPPAPFVREQTPMPGTVIKHEYRCKASSFNDCTFCGSIEHFFAHCLERQRYIDAGKCKIHEEMRKFILPNGNFIPGHGLMKDKLDQYYASRTTQEVKASEGVTAGLFYHANSEIDAIVEVGSSAFVHMIACPDEEESDEDETAAQLWCGTHVLPSASNRAHKLQRSLRAPILQANFMLNVRSTQWQTGYSVNRSKHA